MELLEWFNTKYESGRFSIFGSNGGEPIVTIENIDEIANTFEAAFIKLGIHDKHIQNIVWTDKRMQIHIAAVIDTPGELKVGSDWFDRYRYKETYEGDDYSYTILKKVGTEEFYMRFGRDLDKIADSQEVADTFITERNNVIREEKEKEAFNKKMRAEGYFEIQENWYSKYRYAETNRYEPGRDRYIMAKKQDAEEYFYYKGKEFVKIADNQEDADKFIEEKK
jgi:hypothetical protein